NRRRPIKAGVIRVRRDAAIHIWRRDIQIDIYRGGVSTNWESFAVTAPPGKGKVIEVLILGVPRSGFRWHTVSERRNPGRPGPIKRVRFKALEICCESQTAGRQHQSRSYCPWPRPPANAAAQSIYKQSPFLHDFLLDSSLSLLG